MRTILSTFLDASGRPITVCDATDATAMRAEVNVGFTRMTLGPSHVRQLREALSLWSGDPRSLTEVAHDIPGGPWELLWESCDCGDGFPCGHPRYVTSLVVGDPCNGGAVYETGELPAALLEFLVATREESVALAAELVELRSSRRS